jgi:aromatic-L-amino-acid/L-tryptophan decarboxylase
MNSLEVTSQQFRYLAAHVLDMAAAYSSTIAERPVFPNTSGEETERLFRTALPEHGIESKSMEALAEVLSHSRTQNGRFFGYVQGSADSVAILGDFVASMLNQNITAWRSSPAGVTIERTVVGWLAEAIGCTAFSGTLTGGGSAANLMALAMARESRLHASDEGLFEREKCAIYASEQVHMSIPKAVAILGLGRNNIRYIGCDASYRMLPEKLHERVAQDVEHGYKPVAVIASAGTVNTGSIDPLSDIGAVARAHNLWMHVDGAYGALAAIAVPEKFPGLEQADSLSLDPHKWLYQPLDCGCLLYRDAEIARNTFMYTGTYAKQLTSDPIEGFAFFEESMELSRRFRALKLWLSLRYHGFEAFRQAVRQNLDQAQRLATAVRRCPQLELVGPVELSAVCFRHIVNHNVSEEARNRFNLELLKRIVRKGSVYLSNAELNERFCLRACMVNHLTKDEDIDLIVPVVLEASSDLLPATWGNG